jgi:hypothetical protein
MNLEHWEAKLSPPSMGFGLAFGALVFSWICNVVLGGFKFGSLERRICHRLRKSDYEPLRQIMSQRLAKLGFRSVEGDRVYRQGSAESGDNLKAFTHANVKKELRVSAVEEDDDVAVELSLKYLDPIVGDSGESAYRDAVLDYVLNRTDSMQVVTNRSFAALTSFYGGIFVVIAFLVLKGISFKAIVAAIIIPAVTYAGTGIIALVAISQRPSELTGRGLALAGIPDRRRARRSSPALMALKQH